MDTSGRATRSYRAYLALIAALMAGGLTAGFVTASDDGDWWVLAAALAAMIAFGALTLALVHWAIRRRGAVTVPPLWGVDRAVRVRIGRAIRSQEALSGEEHRLALAEADRVVRAAPVATVGLTVSVALLLAVTALQLTGDVSAQGVALTVIPLLLFAGILVQHLTFHRRAADYLRRHGDLPT